jgi:hypothetical protein
MSQKSGEGQYQYQSKTVEIEGHEFFLTEPDGSDCFNAVGIVMSMIGEPDKLMDSIREAVATLPPGVERGLSIGFKMSFSSDRFRRVPKSNIVDLLEMTTDKDRDWYAENPLSGPALLELIAEVASILPFAGVLSQKGNLAGALVSTFTESSEKSETSSGNGTDGDQKTSPPAESAGRSHAPVALRKDAPEPS